MSKKIVAAMLVCVLLTCYVTSAFAYTIRYCPKCNQDKRYYDGCLNQPSRNSTYIQHDINGMTCNYYLMYYKNKQNCQTCGDEYRPKGSEHLEAEIHSICGGKARCPF